MTRIQILLPKEQDRRLEEVSARRGESKAGLVRRALDRLFTEETEERDLILDLIGQAGRAGQRKASTHHDRILTATERRRNRKR